jgi:hypothetical protein
MGRNADRRATVGSPGTGVYWTEHHPAAPMDHGGHRLALLIAVVALGAVVWWLASA